MKLDNQRMELPDWMGEVCSSNNLEVSGWSRANFLKKSLYNMKKTIAEELLTESYAGRDGILQKLDPRLKLITTVLLIVAVALIRSMPVLLAVWLFTVLIMNISRLPVLVMQKRIWGIIPFITLLVSVPAMFNIINHGLPLVMIYQSPHPLSILGIEIPASIYISRQGFTAGIILFLRVGLSLSLGFLLVMTTPTARLFKSLQVFRIPAFMVMIMEMSYRYLVLLLSLSIEMFEARQLRTVGVLSLSAKREQVGSSIAALFVRSMEMADEVYLAMIARGYTGQAVSIDKKI